MTTVIKPMTAAAPPLLRIPPLEAPALLFGVELRWLVSQEGRRLQYRQIGSDGWQDVPTEYVH